MIIRRLLAALLVTILSSGAMAQVGFAALRVRVSEAVMQNLLLKKVDPVYPQVARQDQIQGTVILQVNISKSGDVENIQQISGQSLLAAAAIDAVKQWKYAPYKLNGSPVAVQTKVSINFTLSNKSTLKGIVGDQPGGIVPGDIGGIARGNDSTTTAVPNPQIGVPQRVRVSAAVEAALLLKKVPPQYPPEAKSKHIEGAVLLHAFIDAQGNVAHLELMSGHPLLAPAAIEAVRQWKYRPYLLNNEPVEVETRIEVNFTLHE
jgi:TonB family protein